MTWTNAFIQLFCLYKGYTIKKLQSKEDLKAAFDLKNKTNQEFYGLPPLPEKDEFIYPFGGAIFLGMYKKRELIGSVQLMDLSIIESYASKLYADVELDYNPSTTYEIKALVVDWKHQNAIGAVYKILIYYCMLCTIKMNRNKWIVATNATFYQLIKRSGLTVELISKEYKVKIDDTTQSRYYQNYVEADILEGSHCYCIEIPKNAPTTQMKKVFRSQIRKKTKRFKNVARLGKSPS